MATESRFKMSQERLDALKKELLYLETDKAKEVAEQIKEARSFGDLSENSEYDEAKTEQGKLYSRIAELKNLVENAEIVENPMEGRISDDSPFGRGLYGHVAGEKVVVDAPVGSINYEIISVEND